MRVCVCLLAEILPLDRYIRAVTICNNLALLASQGSVAQFFQRIAVLSRLQRYWTKGFDTVELSCAEVDAMPPDSDGDDDACGLASLVPVSSAADWDARSDSTVDLKPDISSVVTDVSEAVDVHLAAEQNDGANDDGDEEYRKLMLQAVLLVCAYSALDFNKVDMKYFVMIGLFFIEKALYTSVQPL